MIEELTPMVLMTSMFLIIVSAPIITLLLSALLLWRYRRAVSGIMATTGGFNTSAVEKQPESSTQSGGAKTEERNAVPRGNDLYQRVIRAPLYTAIRYVVSGLAFALIFSVAAQFVYPYGLKLPGFLIGVWIYIWPAVLALPLIVPGSPRLWVVCIAAYLLVLVLLGFWAATINNIPEYRFGAVMLAARSSVTPSGMVTMWFAVNGGATFLMLLCFNRWVRAVAPLLLALVTTAITGTMVANFALFSERGVDAAVALAVSLDLHVIWLVVATWILSLTAFALLGWILARWIALAYRHRRLSDQSLMLDALWLLFASTYSMWLVLGGLAWIATAPLAFLVYKLTLAATNRILPRKTDTAPGLTFLRVFSLGRRSELLLDTIAKYWRHIGSVQMITGPDVARSTVQPHQFLDFLSGKLSRHFVHDRASLQLRMAERDHAPDPDGRFRINNFFCHADSWQAVLPQLVQEGDMVLMDLRNFSAANIGCLHELRYLFHKVPMDRCLLVVDETTDRPFFERVLTEEWKRLPPGSPNHGYRPEQLPVHQLGAGNAAVRELVHRLCNATSG